MLRTRLHLVNICIALACNVYGDILELSITFDGLYEVVSTVASIL